MANAICRSCGNDDVDPNTGSYELCEACWDGFEQDMYDQLGTGEDDAFILILTRDDPNDDSPL